MADPAPGSAWRMWRFPMCVGGLALVALGFLWLSPWVNRDERNFISVPVVAGVLLLLGGWLVVASPFPLAWRRGVVLGSLVLLGLVALVFRLEGYTGDMHPRIVLRWKPRPDALLKLPDVSARPDQPRAAADLATTTPWDYPQYLGPRRIPVVSGIRLARDWNAQPPKRLWRQSMGAGWSGFAVVGDYAVTQEQRGDQELVVCYELRSGRVAWSHADQGRFTSVLGGDGPRATPTIYEGKVYTQGAFGMLNCLDGANGDRIWSRDILKDNAAENINWGRSGSPLVVDAWVIVSAGGTDNRSLVAYHKDSGAFAWGNGSDVSSYSSPTLATLCGVPQVLMVNQDWVVSHRLSDGKLLWRYGWEGNSGSNASASQPVPVGDDRVLLSKGYHVPCTLLELRRGEGEALEVHVVWKKPGLLSTKLTNVVLRDGYVYGLSQGILECVELATGMRRWKRGRYGHGQIVLVDELILVSSETGEVALVEASPEAFRELTRFQAIEGKTWNNPALAGPYLLVRNSEEAACYELPVEQ
jgi:outer membrane protein assembly factor BamB